MQTSFNTVQEIDAPIQLNKFLFLTDLIIMGVYVMIMYQLKGFVYSYLQIPYIIVSAIWGIFFILPSNYNPKRKNWQNIIITMIALKEKRKFEPIRKEIKDYDKPIGEIS